MVRKYNTDKIKVESFIYRGSELQAHFILYLGNYPSLSVQNFKLFHHTLNMEISTFLTRALRLSQNPDLAADYENCNPYNGDDLFYNIER